MQGKDRPIVSTAPSRGMEPAELPGTLGRAAPPVAPTGPAALQHDPTRSIPAVAGSACQADGLRRELHVGDTVQPTTELAVLPQGACYEA